MTRKSSTSIRLAALILAGSCCLVTAAQSYSQTRRFALKADASATAAIRWQWSLEKTEGPESLSLEAGKNAVATYHVDLFATPVQEWTISGTIGVTNPATAREAVDVTGFDQAFGETRVTSLRCSQGLPAALEPGRTLLCSYTVDGTGTVPSLGSLRVYSGETPAGDESIRVPLASITKVTDSCVTLSDLFDANDAETLGTACANGTMRSFSFEYRRRIASPAEGTSRLYNVASYRTNDTGTTGSDWWAVEVK